MIRSGKLRHRLRVVQPSKQTGLAGDLIDSEEFVCLCWAEVNPISSKEMLLSDQNISEVSHKIRVRYNSLFKPDQIGIVGNHRFIFQSIQNWENRNIELTILAREIYK